MFTSRTGHLFVSTLPIFLPISVAPAKVEMICYRTRQMDVQLNSINNEILLVLQVLVEVKTATWHAPPLPPVSTTLGDREAFHNQQRPPRELDTPLGAVYRIYIAIVAADTLTMRAEIEHFFNRPEWKVNDIPEPTIQDQNCKAVLAAIPYLLVKSFNKLIAMGLPRGAPQIIFAEEEERLKTRPKQYETVPSWAESVLPLVQTLRIPDARGDYPKLDHERDDQLLQKNIIAHTLPVFFV